MASLQVYQTTLLQAVRLDYDEMGHGDSPTSSQFTTANCSPCTTASNSSTTTPRSFSSDQTDYAELPDALGHQCQHIPQGFYA